MRSYKYLLLLLLPVATIVSCKKSTFVDANINPSTLTTEDPGSQFLFGAQHFYSDFEGYYDFLRYEGPWMQLWTGAKGNGAGFNAPAANADYRYGNFYGNVGVPLTDIPHIIAKMPAADQPARVYEAAIASIAKAYYAFYVSDINGSIAYSQAFQARYGGTLTPTYDPQQPLFDSLDLEVKTAVATLEASQPVAQVSYGGNDPFYNGNVTNWIKAGNALRLKMAMRLMKRDPATLASIATSVLADANQMSSIGDSWVLFAGPSFATSTGNFNPQGFLAPQPVVNFMLAKSDPRLRIFYRPNNIGNYLGSPTNPDTCTDAYYTNLYQNSLDTFSTLQHRMFTPNYDEGDGNGVGSGVFFMPIITYAEYCFIRAELGARGITTDNAGNWYTAGVTASIQFYSAMGDKAKISNFVDVTAGEITTYLGKAGVTFDPTKAVEQIACQAYLDFFRQPSEAWAWWKRTGFPNTTSVLPWSPLTYQGATLPLPRRAALTVLSSNDANYANQNAAYTAMQQDPGFGTPDNAFGRVWWDQQ